MAGLFRTNYFRCQLHLPLLGNKTTGKIEPEKPHLEQHLESSDCHSDLAFVCPDSGGDAINLCKAALRHWQFLTKTNNPLCILKQKMVLGLCMSRYCEFENILVLWQF
jgi:hypothetical protein